MTHRAKLQARMEEIAGAGAGWGRRCKSFRTTIAVCLAGLASMVATTAPATNYRTEYSYDAMRRVTSATGPEGAFQRNTYNANGWLMKSEALLGSDPASTDPADWAVTETAYSAGGKPVTVTDPDGDISQTVYDAAGRAYLTIDPEGRKTYTVFDPVGRPLNIIRAWQGNEDGSWPLASELKEACAVPGTLQQCYQLYTYTDNGKVASVTDANDNTTSYAYDDFDRPLRTTFPDGSYTEVQAYDEAGNVLQSRTRKGDVLYFDYDALDRQTRKSTPDQVNVFGYDLLGRQTCAESHGPASGITACGGGAPVHALENVYDAAGRLLSATSARGGVSRTVAYGYDAASNRTVLTWDDGYQVNYAYDDLGRMESVTEAATATVLASLTYDVLSRLKTLTYANGAAASLAYEADGDLASLDHGFGTGNFGYTFGYNKAGQLTSNVPSDPMFEFGATAASVSSYAVNNLNQYTTITTDSVPAAITHDLNGNFTGDGSNGFTYDAENRLITAAMGGGANVAYAYDPMGRRAAKAVDGVTTEYLSDADHAIAEYDGTNTLLRRYIYGPGTDRPIAMVEGDAASGFTRHFYHADRSGSVVALTDDGGAAVARYVYDAYGTPYIVDPGTGAQTQVAAGQPYLFTGRRFDFETGLYYYRARYYSASLGRFLQTDPVGYEDQMNLYAYVGNDPVNAWDPDGRYQRGDGWSDSEWEQFDAKQKQVASDMRESASNLKADAVEAQKMGDAETAAGYLEEAGWLERGAAVLESDGKNAPKAHLKGFNYGDKDKTPKPHPFGEVNPKTKDVTFNRNHEIIKQRHNWSTTKFKFGVGHESIHSAGLLVHAEVRFPQPYGLTTAYRYGTGKEPEAFKRIPMGSPEARRNPDHIMSRVYP